MNADRPSLPRQPIRERSSNPICLTRPIGVRSTKCASAETQPSHIYDSFLAERGILPRSEPASEIFLEWMAA
jgi:hypothetical protein